MSHHEVCAAMEEALITSDNGANTGRMRHWTSRDAVVAVFAVMVAFIGYDTWWPTAPINNPDAPSYMRVASDLKELKLTRFHQRTPGYPLIMLLTGSDQGLTRALFHAMLGAQLLAALVMAYVLARLGISQKITSTIFAIALLPPYVAPSAFAQTESVCSFSVVVAFSAVTLWIQSGRPGLLILFAIAAAYATFVRPTFQMMVPVVAVVLVAAYWAHWTGHLRFRKLVLSMAFAAVVTFGSLGAYAFLNYRCFGQFDTCSMSARAMSSKVATVLEYLPDKYADLRSVLVKHRDNLITAPFLDHTGQDYIYRAMPDLLRMYDGDEMKALRVVKQASVHLIKAKPFTYVHESMKLFASYWMPNDYELPGLERGVGRATSAIFQFVVNIVFAFQVVVVLGLMFTFVSVRIATGRPDWWPLAERDKTLSCVYVISLAIVLYAMFVSCFIGTGLNRYRTATELLIFANTAIGLTLWSRGVHALSRSVGSS